MGLEEETFDKVDATFPIVAIGASAGGVEALTAFFKRIPAQPRAAFVVITHLAAHRDSLMPEILSRCTDMPVNGAEDGMALVPAHVYVIPPDAILTIADGHVALSPRGGERNLIDLCLVSLAQAAANRAVAIILSGTGSDGALGLKAVRAAGGFTMAQGREGATPGHNEMPDAAIATGFVDCVLPIDDLADRLATYIDGFAIPHLGDRDAARSDLEEIKRELFVLLQQRVGHDFSGYKPSTFLRRIERRMNVHHVSDLTSYLALVRSEPDEIEALFRDLLISVTEFFRDTAAFDVIRDVVAPRLLAGKGRADKIRIWVPGCATGEEAYSIAITLLEQLEQAPTPPELQIFATDVDQHALSIARMGRYPATLLDGMTPERLARFFVREDGNYVVAKKLRETCLFSCHSLIRDPPFSRIDLISCRNLLIYLDINLQNQVIPLFHYALRSDGILFLGASEHIGQHTDLFSPLDKKHRIFVRRDLPSRPTVFPSLRHAPARSTLSSETCSGRTVPEAVRRSEALVLEKYAPAHVVVGRDWGVLHYSVRTGKYLEPPPGAPSRNLLEMARPGLRLALRSALLEAVETNRRTCRDAIAVDVTQGTQIVNLSVEPLPNTPDQPAWLIVFTDVGPLMGHDSAERPEAPYHPDEIIQLENELRQTHEQLQSVVEDYQASVEELKSSNEEMLSVNEELQSSNEELETSKEELQSVNEELHTVNAELSRKIEELDLSNSDLKNLFDSTRIATIFLDEHLVIRSFTQAASKIFKLIPNDYGRPLSDIVSDLAYDGLAADVARMLASHQPLERRLLSRDGQTHYLMRILPYLSTEGKPDGVIVTFVDVTAMAELAQQQALVAELNHRVKNILAVIASMAAQMMRRSSSVKEFGEAFIGHIDGLAKTHEMLSRSNWSDVTLHDLVAGELKAFVADGGRATVTGPDVHLLPQAVTTLGAIVHELSTNAVKYGALANADGRLEITWRLEDLDGTRHIIVCWRESGGPPVQAPLHKGFGTEFVERSVDYEFGGAATLDYRSDGLVATLIIPTNEVVHLEVAHVA